MRALLLATMVAVSPVAHADLNNATTTLKAGNWKVLRAIDLMTDKPTCTGILKDDYGVQLTRDKLYVRVDGGISYVTLRFGEDPARPSREGTKLEKDIHSIIISGLQFEDAINKPRLRAQVLTLVSGIQSFDLDMRGIVEAQQHIAEGCPLPQSGPATAAAREVAPAATPAADAPCSPEMVQRLREARLTESQIKVACRR